MKVLPLSEIEASCIKKKYALIDGKLFTILPVKYPTKNPYRQLHIYIDGGDRRVLLHRVIHFLKTGEWPENVDHIDGNPLNNSPENLRGCTVSQNMQNRKPTKGKKGGLPVGVAFATGGDYHAYVQVGKRRQFQKRFKRLEDAIAYREEMAHKHYGQFSSNSCRVL